ncbi:MAG: hypothetical protein WA885_16685 [Phormidesmis sp.]
MTTLWIDAHLSPALAHWITDSFDATAIALRDLGLRDAEDLEIFAAVGLPVEILLIKGSEKF